MGLHSPTTEGCPGASTTRGLLNQGPPQPGDSTTRGLHNQGPPHMSCHLLFLYSRVRWASTAPLLKAAQGPPQPGASTTRGNHMSKSGSGCLFLLGFRGVCCFCFWVCVFLVFLVCLFLLGVLFCCCLLIISLR